MAILFCFDTFFPFCENIKNHVMNVMFFSSIAISTKESLEQQKKSLTGITQKVNALASILYTKIQHRPRDIDLALSMHLSVHLFVRHSISYDNYHGG